VLVYIVKFMRKISTHWSGFGWSCM